MVMLCVALVTKLMLFRSRISSNNLDRYKGAPANAKSGCWVLVTGATDGVGLCFAKLFAKHGFNLILVSRNLQKLKDVASDLHDSYQISTEVLQQDFSKFDTFDDFSERLKACISGLDVGILVNNVGTSFDMPTLLHEVPLSKVLDITMINVYATTMMTHVLLNDAFVGRNKQSAIINIGSSAGTTPTPMLSAYSASKSYVAHMTECLKYEYPSVDFLNFAPGTLCTKMVGAKKPGILVADPSVVVGDALKRLGVVTHTNPYWVHYLLDLPGCCFLTRGLWISNVTRTLKSARAKILRHKAKVA